MHAIGLQIKQSLAGVYPESEIKCFIKIILTEVLGFNITDYYMGKDIKISVNQARELEEIIERLKKHEPIQYILGHEDFLGRNFIVAPGVLIPRPETAEMVSLIVKENRNEKKHILDIGTGSGCIAISLSKELPHAIVDAWDVSTVALKIAQKNNERLDANVNFSEIDILSTTQIKEKYDIIVSNPPYIMNSEKEEMEENVLQWEPSLALFVPNENPLLFYRKIAELGVEILNMNGRIYFEINQAFGPETEMLLTELGYKETRIIKDLAGLDRIVTGIK